MTYALWSTVAVALLLTLCMATPGSAGEKDVPKFPSLDDKGWKKLDNGMRVWDVKVGDGAEIKPGDTIKIHYTGWLTTGKVFDSSKSRGEPIEFPLKRLIKGWQEGVPGMKIGGVRRLEIPYNLGYGEDGTPDGSIPGKATLIFEIEALGTKN